MPERNPTDLALYRDHFARLTDYTDRLREGRCRRTRNFDEGLGHTMAVFQPLFAPWNMQILFALYMHGPQRFNALKRTLAGISSRVLTDKLRHLASQDLVVHSDTKPAAYGLARQGDIVARHLHPLVFQWHNRDGPLPPRHPRRTTGKEPSTRRHNVHVK